MLTHQTAFCCGFLHVIFIWNFFKGTHYSFWWSCGSVVIYSYDSISWFFSNFNSSFSCFPQFFLFCFNFPQFHSFFLNFPIFFSIFLYFTSISPLFFVFFAFFFLFSTFFTSHPFLSPSLASLPLLHPQNFFKYLRNH